MDTYDNSKRSSKYPFIGLKKAVDCIQRLKNKEKGNYTPVSVALDHWGYSPKSSGGIRTVSTLNQYGLLDIKGKGSDRTIRPSQLASTILDSPNQKERRNATKVAALNPELFYEIWEQYEGNLPSEDSLKWELTGRGDPSVGRLTEQAVGSFLKVFLETLEYAGIIGQMHEMDETDHETVAGNSTSASNVPEQESFAVSTAVSSYIELPLPAGPGIEGTIRIPKPLTSSQWEKVLDSLKTIANLKVLIVDDTNLENDHTESKDGVSDE